MRYAVTFLMTMLPCLFTMLAPAEIIDRIAVAVDHRVITESEIRRQIRITAFLNGEEPDFSAANKRLTADRLVEQMLIRRELEMRHYAASEINTNAVSGQLQERFNDTNSYNQALAKYGITDSDVRNALEWQATLLEFIDLRFRPGVQVPEADIRDYYNQQAEFNPGKLPPFEEAREEVEEILTARHVDNALDRWLGQARTRTTVRYMQEVFQ
jgi:hypothetical protein